MKIFHEELEDWSVRVAELLQEICDDAQTAVGEPDSQSECLDIRCLLRQHSSIIRGEPLWLRQIADISEEPIVTLKI